jgi:predicted HAD superfamily Cof-like phosphohydrolase
VRRAQEMVGEFHVAAQQDDPGFPSIPSRRVQELRLKLHEEEAVTELREAFESRDILKVADAIGDALYVVLGTALACGIDIEPIFEEIHRSNMTKFVDGTFREDGKYVKGPSYVKAQLGPIIAAQIERGRVRCGEEVPA